MKKNKRLSERRKKIAKDVDLLVQHSFDFVDRIHEILEEQGKEQKDLAKALGKSESEISKWMTGTHNFTFRTIAKIEAALGESIIHFNKVEEKTKEEKVNYIKNSMSRYTPTGKKYVRTQPMDYSCNNISSKADGYLC
ncbi:XRE family transcriptional regulator [Puteibacter caeruleilacunae]|nr:XRE family transcriptional regulator [Puteibacter caeruleilacunae]